MLKASCVSPATLRTKLTRVLATLGLRGLTANGDLLPRVRVVSFRQRGPVAAAVQGHRREQKPARSEHRRFLAAAICLGISSVTLWVAALTPQFWPVWSGDDPLGPISRYPALWLWNSVLFLMSALVTLPGVAFAFPPSLSPWGIPILLLLTIATALWSGATVFRISVMPTVAADRTPEGGTWYAEVLPWVSAAWLIAAGLLITVFAAIGTIILTTGVLSAWAGWIILTSAVFSAALFIVTRDMPPVVAYLPVPPLTIAAVMKARGAG